MIVNVCPAATSKAPPDRFWSMLTAPERVGDWAGAAFIRADPPGPMRPGQTVRLAARAFGRGWPLTMEVREVDRERRSIDVLVALPFGIENHEHLTLTATPEGGTLVRLN